MTHTTIFQRANGDEDDIEIEVEFTLSGGSDASGLSGPPEDYDPGSVPEFIVVAARIIANDTATELTDAEAETIEADVMDRLSDFEDDGDFYDDSYCYKGE